MRVVDDAEFARARGAAGAAGGGGVDASGVVVSPRLQAAAEGWASGGAERNSQAGKALRRSLTDAIDQGGETRQSRRSMVGRDEWHTCKQQ